MSIIDAIIIASFMANIEMGLYIFCPKFKAWVDELLKED